MALGGRPERDERRILFSISQASPIKDFSSDLPKGCFVRTRSSPGFLVLLSSVPSPGVDRTAWTRVAILLARISFACRDRQKDFVFPRPRCSDAIHYSALGLRQATGVLRLPDFLNHLKAAGFRLEAQARVSKLYLVLAKLHIYPVYREKGQRDWKSLTRKTPFYAPDILRAYGSSPRFRRSS